MEGEVDQATLLVSVLISAVRVTSLRRGGDKATSSTPWTCPATVSPCQGSGRRKPGFESCSPATSVVSVAQDGTSAQSSGVKSIAGEPERLVWCRLVQGGLAMDTSNLLIKFARIGARLKVADRPSRRFRTASGVVSLDVLEDREGEFFEVARRSETDPDVAVLDVQPAERHLLLLVRDGDEKQKFLCGHDERHWFVAAVPESAPVGTVRQAKEACSSPPRYKLPRDARGSERRLATVARTPPTAARANGSSCRCLASTWMRAWCCGTSRFAGAAESYPSFTSNSDRGTPDWRMIDRSVPILSSLWSGTGTVVVPDSSWDCITIWLLRRRTSTNP